MSADITVIALQANRQADPRTDGPMLVRVERRLRLALRELGSLDSGVCGSRSPEGSALGHILVARSATSRAWSRNLSLVAPT